MFVPLSARLVAFTADFKKSAHEVDGVEPPSPPPALLLRTLCLAPPGQTTEVVDRGALASPTRWCTRNALTVVCFCVQVAPRTAAQAV